MSILLGVITVAILFVGLAIAYAIGDMMDRRP